MKFCVEELKVIKDLLSNELDELCRPEVPLTGAKELAYLPLEKFDTNDNVEHIKWCQIILRKIIMELVELNGN